MVNRFVFVVKAILGDLPTRSTSAVDQAQTQFQSSTASSAEPAST
jgi:hypothetical protein